KIVAAYKNVLKELEKRFNVISVIRYLIENPDFIKASNEELFKVVKEFLEKQNHNILNSYVNENEIRLYVQTENGLEELIINDDLFTNPLYEEANYIYQKIKDRDLKFDKDILEILDDVEKNAKKGAYIQRYKGLGEMNPDQLWETTMDPNNRRLLKITIEDAQRADETFNLFMGDDVEPRREYIQAHAKDVKHLDV
ncbi:DNA gyrase subunit B, partial [Campylobacter lari]|nr:DNA gyrase subunit B [Campylobacter lari]